MAYRIDEIEGIGPAFREKLLSADIKTTDDFLEKCCDKKGRATIAEDTGLTATQLLTWANMADLMRISGIGRQNAELLKAAGVDTVKELRTRNAENLATKVTEINEAKKLAKATPALTAVSGWIDQAKETEPLITH